MILTVQPIQPDVGTYFKKCRKIGLREIVIKCVTVIILCYRK